MLGTARTTSRQHLAIVGAPLSERSVGLAREVHAATDGQCAARGASRLVAERSPLGIGPHGLAVR